MVFTFMPEWCSTSLRNAVQLGRNPSFYSHSLPADRKAASKVWHNALADVISEDRFRKAAQNLGKSRKLAVNY